MAKRAGSITGKRTRKAPHKTAKRKAIKRARLEALAKKRGFKR